MKGLRPALLTVGVLLAVAGLTGCTSGSGSGPASSQSTSAVAAFLGGDPSRLPLTGPAGYPIRWTLKAGLTPTQQAVQVALQRLESFAAVQATTGPLPSYTAMVSALSRAQDQDSVPSLETAATHPGSGVIWEQVYVVSVSGQTAFTTVCRDQRSLAAAVPATLTPKPGVDLSAAKVVGTAVTYKWVYAHAGDPTSPGPLRWRTQGSSSGVAGSPSNEDCVRWARTHRTWPGASAG